MSEFEKDYLKELDDNKEYSLEVDPLNKYNMGDTQKSFIKYYVEFKNVPLASKMAGIEQEVGEAYFISYSSQNEIRRINKALIQRQFLAKMMSLDEIGGYLTSLITEDNVPLADRLKTREKLDVIKMLMDLNVMKSKCIENPSTLNNSDLDREIKELSVDTIKQLLNTSGVKEKKKEAINEIKKNNSSLTPEELSYLESLPTTTLLNLLDENNKNKKNK